MKLLVLTLAATLALGAPGRGVTVLEERRPAAEASPLQHADTSTGAAFSTDLERGLWQALVLLEGDVKTATRSLAACETHLAELEAPPPPPPSPAPRGLDVPPWVLGALVGLAAAGGFTAGVLIRR